MSSHETGRQMPSIEFFRFVAGMKGLAHNLKEEIERFLDSLSTEQFTKVAEFVQNIPRLSHTFDITCPKCNHVEKKTVEGLESFF